MTALSNTVRTLFSPDGALLITLVVAWWVVLVWAIYATVSIRLPRRRK